jgi:DNA replication and repair protein RecF
MFIKKIKLTNFRNHLKTEFIFEKGINIIIGPNGAGKTNVLEAIYLLASSKSNRARFDKDLINHGKNFCTVNGVVYINNEDFELEVQIKADPNFDNSSSKTVKINKVSKSQKNFNDMLNAVFFTPQDIDIITGSPSDRRRYLDQVIAQVDYGYKRDLASYIKSLRQRNKILELMCEENKGYDQIDFWTEQVLLYGQRIQEKREEFFEFVSEELRKDNNLLKKGLEFIYTKNEISMERLEKYRNKEIMLKTTMVGPHRDDFIIKLDEYDISEFGSRGQQRSALLALKVLEIIFKEKSAGERPILLLDDIFSELDEKHKDEVNRLAGAQQTIISCTEIPEMFKGYKTISIG